VIALNGSVFASRSGIMNEFCRAIASISSGNGFFRVILIVLSSATPQVSTAFATVWPNVPGSARSPARAPARRRAISTHRAA
jgi:hypothetical protein